MNMYSRTAAITYGVIACALLVPTGAVYSASEVSVTVGDDKGTAVEGAVVIAEPLQGPPRPRSGQMALMDQRNLRFVPDVLVVQTGTAVTFPNSDQVRHHVYSFSIAKKFELSLYAGKPSAPVIFDHPGLVTLGCNIHDNMLGYVWVTDSPWYGRTDREGRIVLRDLPTGEYNVRVWHALSNATDSQVEQRLSVKDGQAGALSFRFKRPLRPGVRTYGQEKSWADY